MLIYTIMASLPFLVSALFVRHTNYCEFFILKSNFFTSSFLPRF